VDLTLGHVSSFREPRRIEILGQNKIAHFQSDLAYYRTALIALFLQEERANHFLDCFLFGHELPLRDLPLMA
jgi:hypothetical protein